MSLNYFRCSSSKGNGLEGGKRVALSSTILCVRKVFKYWPFWVISGLFWLPSHYQFYVNVSPSLPQKYWIVALQKKPKREDYVCFRAAPDIALQNAFSQDVTMTKQVLGVVGDTVTREGRDFYINGQYIASAKTHSLKGEPLKVGLTGTLKTGQYYVSTPHKDSFDSRYEKMGWLEQSQIIGVAYPLW
jgi:conjugal transfer pilin signal peptidase TrbI